MISRQSNYYLLKEILIWIVQFLPFVSQWKELWKETNEIFSVVQKPKLLVSAVESVSLYLFPKVVQAFLRQNYNLKVSYQHSPSAYTYMESGLLDLAFIEEPRYSKHIHATPAFSEPFVVVAGSKIAEGDTVSVSDLLPEYEIHVSWNPEFESWHAKSFDEKISPLIILSQDSLIPYVLEGEAWGIAPYSTGINLKKQGFHLYRLLGGSPDRFIYYIVHGYEKNKLIPYFVSLLDQELRIYPEIISFLVENVLYL
ncbi:hypothetical protein D3Z51_10930 [Clostridiaceae bacterium]|nr:hypothetical protein [Clostridiaceae bacterium]RKI13134.1 hypothetical protein D7V81_11120 [bacterium 1XD21-70]